MSTGLYQEARTAGLLVNHEVVAGSDLSAEAGITLLPDQIRTISYPYEWCFSQLKAAAVLVLDLQELALAKDLSLKDATAYNIQFVDGRPVFIDTSSFELYRNGMVWPAYRQYCEHFLTPLLLMSRVDVRLGRMLQTFIDGIPVDLAASLVSRKTWINPWLYMHVGLHGKAQRRQSGIARKSGEMPKSALMGLLKSLRQAVQSLSWTERASTWGAYSSASSYDENGSKHKHELLAAYKASLEPAPKLVWDLGANAGEFSRIFSSSGIETVAWDADHAAVEHNYCQIVGATEKNLLPLVQDFSSPSPAIGWCNEERASFMQRGTADLILALALIHHLVIGNSVPLGQAAEFFSRLGPTLVIEFVDPEDPRVKQLTSTRSDWHPYDQSAFEAAFAGPFEIVRKDAIRSSRRTLYLMRRRSA